MFHIKFCCQAERMYAYSKRTWKRPKGKHNLWFPEDYTGQPLGSKVRPRGRCQRILDLRTFEYKCLIEGIGNRF